MKPDAFMPFYFRSFWEAVEELPDWMIVAYMRSLSYNWGHRGCEGLRNEENAIRKLCRVDESNWEECWNTLFSGDEFWVIGSDGLWHQKFQDKLWTEASANYQKRVNGGKDRWKNIPREQRSEIARQSAAARWNASKNAS